MTYDIDIYAEVDSLWWDVPYIWESQVLYNMIHEMKTRWNQLLTFPTLFKVQYRAGVKKNMLLLGK